MRTPAESHTIPARIGGFARRKNTLDYICTPPPNTIFLSDGSRGKIHHSQKQNKQVRANIGRAKGGITRFIADLESSGGPSPHNQSHKLLLRIICPSSGAAQTFSKRAFQSEKMKLISTQ
jgi:hypothetical protein